MQQADVGIPQTAMINASGIRASLLHQSERQGYPFFIGNIETNEAGDTTHVLETPYEHSTLGDRFGLGDRFSKDILAEIMSLRQVNLMVCRQQMVCPPQATRNLLPNFLQYK